jgi:FtsP/CotA-like multicopper oxidase with cupredoxin domain
VRRAFRKLDQIRKDTVWWSAAAQPGALIAAGTVNMSSAYWRFTRTGTVAFACLQTGHMEAGMTGAVAVQ